MHSRQIQAKQLVHLDAGVITAAVSVGSGGNIQITADNYFAFPGTLVDASSDLGIDGIVEVHTPDVDLAGKLTTLPTTFLDAASLMRERCAARRSGERAGSFAVRGNRGIRAEPDGWLPASVSSTFATSVPAPSTGSRSGSVPSRPGLLLAGSCH